MAVGSKFRSVVRNPEEFAADLKKALTHTVSQAEALDQAALEQAQRCSGGHPAPWGLHRPLPWPGRYNPERRQTDRMGGQGQ